MTNVYDSWSNYSILYLCSCYFPVRIFGYAVFCLVVVIRAVLIWKQTRNECHRRKITLLNYVSGNYLHPWRTKVRWQWNEPVIVGQVMTFVLEVSTD